MERVSIRVAGKYILDRKIGSGSFGVIFHGFNAENNDEVAAKLESTTAKMPQLIHEAKTLRSLRGGVGIPKLFWSGTEGDYNIMVMELLGSTIEDLFGAAWRKFSVKTVTLIGVQILERLEFMHKKHYIHRDLKPENFIVARIRQNVVYAIDFGLSKRYRDSKTLQHIPPRQNRSLTGTARYAAVNSHLGLELGRRDDIESLAYILIYFMSGQLPWQGIVTGDKRDKYNQILEIKNSMTPHALCKGMPGELATLLTYARAMKFEDEPDYAYLKGLFVGIADREHFAMDSTFDWMEQATPARLIAPKAVQPEKVDRKKSVRRRKDKPAAMSRLRSRSFEPVRVANSTNPDDRDSNATDVGKLPSLFNRSMVMRALDSPQYPKPTQPVQPKPEKSSCRVF
jgi:casein kinase 1